MRQRLTLASAAQLDRVFTQSPPTNILEHTAVLLPDTGETTHETDRTERRSAGTPALRLGQLFTPAISLQRAKLHYYHSFLEETNALLHVYTCTCTHAHTWCKFHQLIVVSCWIAACTEQELEYCLETKDSVRNYLWKMKGCQFYGRCR